MIADSGRIVSYLEGKYRADPGELGLHRRELSTTVYGSPSLGPDETVGRLREALAGEGIEVLDELDLFPLLDRKGVYKMLLAADQESIRLVAGTDPGAAALALLITIYDQDGRTRVDAVEPERPRSRSEFPR